MSELRYRPPVKLEAPAPGDLPRPGAPDQRGGPDAGRTPDASEARPARERVGSYDADAEFKRPVPKPDGYLPDDTGGNVLTRIASRLRGDRPPGHAGPAARPDPAGRDDRVHQSDDDMRLTPAGYDESTGRRPWPREVAEADRGDAVRAVVDRPAFRDPNDSRSPDRYGNPLTRPDGTRVPCFDGPPRREQTRQGWAGDCGIISALGAVAAHRPEEITRRVQPREDGCYQVTLSETRSADGVSEPTGRDIELTITPELPVYDDDAGTPACTQTEDGAAWCAAMEKAFAGVDQTWTPQRRITWMNSWAEVVRQDQFDGVAKPRTGSAPTGYARLHQGTTPWERAEVLTQLTGQHAEVREFPSGRDEWRINRIIRAQLDDGKPVLVSSRERTHEREHLPYRLEPGHVYEVTGVERGKIHLRNPWNRKHPEPMETDEFARNMRRYYSTLI